MVKCCTPNGIRQYGRPFPHSGFLRVQHYDEKIAVLSKSGSTKEYTFQVNNGQELAMDVSFVTEAGPLNVWIAKDGERKNAVYERNNVQMSSFTVTVHEQGKYIIHLDADNHCGSYLFTRK